VNDPDQSVSWRSETSDDLLERLTAMEDPADFDDRFSADPTTGLASLGFIFAAIRRRARLWCGLAVVGLLVGCGFYVISPPAHSATVSVLIVDNSAQPAPIAIQTDTALAQSTPVAAAAVRQLGLKETPGTFLGSYTVTVVTYQVLQISAKGTSAADAVRRASAIATQFLNFHAQYALNQQQQTQTEANQQVKQAQDKVNSLTDQINALSPGAASEAPDTPGLSAKLRNLLSAKDAATTSLGTVQAYASSTVSSIKTTTQQVIKGSEVLVSAKAAKRSLLTGPGLYALSGLIGGLALGLAIVIVGAITSERLRRRDDIAYVAGAPVRLSVGPLTRRGWLSASSRKAARRSLDMERVIEHLRNAVPKGSRAPAGLAVVAVDDVKSAAEAVVALAASLAKQHQRLVVADLSSGAHAARLAGADGPGVHAATLDGASVTIAVPEAHDIAPAGPLRGPAFSNLGTRSAQEMAAACADSDVILSLVTLDPAFGGDYLAAWATEAVLMVTAGESTAVRIHAAGEMVRLAGMRKSSVIVVNADKQDESLGTVSTPYHPASNLSRTP
jgi:capsular polysaccharide biosynthesis protein